MSKELKLSSLGEYGCDVEHPPHTRIKRITLGMRLRIKPSERGYDYCWFSHDVTKIQTKKLSILLRFYFHDALEQLKTNFHTNFRFKRVLGFLIEDA